MEAVPGALDDPVRLGPIRVQADRPALARGVIRKEESRRFLGVGTRRPQVADPQGVLLPPQGVRSGSAAA